MLVLLIHSCSPSFWSETQHTLLAAVLILHTGFISGGLADCFVACWIILDVRGPKGRLIAASFS